MAKAAMDGEGLAEAAAMARGMVMDHSSRGRVMVTAMAEKRWGGGGECPSL